jgi:starch synthase
VAVAAPRVLFVTPEIAPWAKVGGLGEVSRDLPRALAALGADLRVLVPAYPALKAAFPGAREAARIEGARILLAPAEVPLYLVAHAGYFERDGTAYQTPQATDWPDNHLRFALLSRVAAWIGGGALDWKPETVHCNDWPCGLTPAYLHFAGVQVRTLMAIHNLSFQGLFPRDALAEVALPQAAFSAEGVEFHGQLSFLKAGLHYASRIVTVSPTYAREIRTAESGWGLDGLLRHRAADVCGILNGVDTETWDPARDPHLAATYDAARLERKRANKAALQRELELEQAEAVPLIGMVCRLTWQKGIDLVAAASDAIAALPAQLAVLGTGEPDLERALQAAAARHPRRIAARIAFSEALAHRIEAGADLFLMPSRFEPSGLNQFYSMRYGTPPVARRTGGLADSIEDGVTGYLFDEASAEGVLGALRRAVQAWREPGRWRAMQHAGMSRDFGWRRAARQYFDLYGELAAVVRRGPERGCR